MADGPEIGEAYVRIRPKTDGFETEAQKQIGDPLKNVAKGAAAAFAAIAVGSFLKGGVEELGSAEKAAAQTEAALKSTGGAANVTADDIDELTTSVANLAGADKEAVQGGANLLLTFRNVRNEVGAGNNVYDQALTAAQDLSVAFGQDLQSSAILVGKALDNPIQGLTALQRVGVTLSAQQKESVKDFVAQGDVISAQKVILEELNKQVGGSAEAYGETLPGKLDRARNAFDDLKAEIVGGAAPALEVIVDKVKPVVDAFADLPTGVQSGVLALGAVVLLAPKLVSAGKAIADSVTGARDAIGKFNADTAAGIGITAGLAASVAALAAASAQAQATAKEGAQGARESIEAAAKSDTFDELVARIERTKAAYVDLYNDANPLVAKNAGAVADAAIGLTDYANRAVDLGNAVGISANEAKAWLDEQERAGHVFPDAASAVAGYTGVVDTSTTSTEGATVATDAYAGSIRDATKATQEATDPFFAASSAADALAEAQGAAYRAAVQYGKNSPEALAANEALTKAAIDQEAALANLAASLADSDTSTADFDSTLRRLVESGSLTQEQVDQVRYKFELLRAKAEEVGHTVVEPTVSDASIVAALALTQKLQEQFERLGNDSAGGGFAVHGAGDAQSIPFDVRQYLASLNRKAAGGRVSKGQPYLVDEYGTEALNVGGDTVLIPGQDGTVIPESRVGAADRRSIVQHFHIGSVTSQTGRALAATARRAGLEALSS